MIRRKFIALNASHIKEEKFIINKLSSHITKVGKKINAIGNKGNKL